MIGEPQDMDAEKAVLGAIFLMNESMPEIASMLAPGDFYRPAHRAVFDAMLGLFRAKEPIDSLTVCERLKAAQVLDVAGGQSFVLSLDAFVPATANHLRYARRVKDMAVRRALIATAAEIVRDAQDDSADLTDVLNAAEQRIAQVRDSKAESRPLVTIGASVRRVYERIAAASEHGKEITGVRCGFPEIDKVTTGWQRGELVILAARSGIGKTSLAMNFAEHAAAVDKTPVLVFSLEMAEDALTQRLMAGHAGVDGQRLRTGRLDPEDWRKLARACDALYRAPIVVDDQPGITVLDMKARARRVLRDHPSLGLIIVDYLQLARAENRGRRREFSREQEVAAISRGLKELARELRLPVIALAQLKRELDGRANKKPMLSDLRESGAIEMDADLVTFIHRAEKYDENAKAGEAEFIIAKNRNGPTPEIPLTYRAEFTRFEPREGWG